LSVIGCNPTAILGAGDPNACVIVHDNQSSTHCIFAERQKLGFWILALFFVDTRAYSATLFRAFGFILGDCPAGSCASLIGFLGPAGQAPLATPGPKRVGELMDREDAFAVKALYFCLPQARQQA
jgi:hypothetical protein